LCLERTRLRNLSTDGRSLEEMPRIALLRGDLAGLEEGGNTSRSGIYYYDRVAQSIQMVLSAKS